MIKHTAMLRKLAVFCAVLLLALAGAGGQAAFAADESDPPQLSGHFVPKWSNDEAPILTLEFWLDTNPGLCGYQTRLYYDADILTPLATNPLASENDRNYAEFGLIEDGLGGSALGTENSNKFIHIGIAGIDNVTTTTDYLFSVSFTVKSDSAERDTTLYLPAPYTDGAQEDVISIFTFNEIDFSLGHRVFTNDSNLSITVTTPAADRFELSAPEQPPANEPLSIDNSKQVVSGDFTAQVLSVGSGFTGQAKAILCCYQGGRMLGCLLVDVDVTTGQQQVTFDKLSFPLKGEGDVSLKLFMLNTKDQTPAFSPLCPSLTITPAA